MAIKLKDIMAISGQPGLFKFISEARNGVIVESLLTGKRMHVPATAKISSLEDIAIFTETDEVPLKEIMFKLKEKEEGEQSIDHRADPGTLKSYMEELLPEYDRSRVYVSDIKKLIQWYNLLQEKNMLEIEAEEEEKKVDGKTNEKKKGSANVKETEAKAKEKKAPAKTGDKKPKAGAGQRQAKTTQKASQAATTRKNPAAAKKGA